MERDPMEMALSIGIVLDNILSHLNVQDLLDCRYVSKFWNKEASSVLRKRSVKIIDISEEKELLELGDCMDQSSDFPFAGLRLAWPWRLSSAGAMGFFKKYGARFTSLYLGTSRGMRPEDQAPFLKHLSRLSILELDRPSSRLPPELLDSMAGQVHGEVLNLPALRTLRIHSSGLTEDILRQVSTAASPSLRIECLETSYEILNALKSAGKLQAVSIIEVLADAPGRDIVLRVDRLLSNETPALTKLDFKDAGCISRQGLLTLLISSQHTLKELSLFEVYPSEFSEECPVLPKLTTLTLWIYEPDEHLFPHESIFQGRQGHKFPALKSMTLYNGIHPSITVNFSDGLFLVPSLKTIDFVGCVKTAGIEDLARSFPNVIEIVLRHAYYVFEQSWYTDPTDIWSVGAFKKLEKFVIWPFTIQSPTKILDNFKKYKNALNLKKFKMMNMDSFLTGIPIGICENLRKHPQQNLKDTLINEILRDSPSLLQLERLKELIVCVKPSIHFHGLGEVRPTNDAKSDSQICVRASFPGMAL